MLKDSIIKILNNIKNSVFIDKYTCILCSAEYKLGNMRGLCDKCVNALPYNNGKICNKCGKPIYDESDYCIECGNNKRYFNVGYSPLIYKDETVKLISRFKFKNAAYLGKYLSAFMLEEIKKRNIKADVIAYVPSDKNTIKTRGYNQAKILATYISDALNIKISHNILRKSSKRVQHTLIGKERRLNLEKLFYIEDKTDFKGKTVLLIDDVLTTGATLDAISYELTKCKAINIIALTLANTPYKLYKV